MPLISPANRKAAEQSGPDNTKGDLRCSHQNEGRLRRIRRADVDAYLEEQLRFQAVQSSREVNMPRDDYKQSANTLLDGRISLAQVINNGIEPPDELEPISTVTALIRDRSACSPFDSSRRSTSLSVCKEGNPSIRRRMRWMR